MVHRGEGKRGFKENTFGKEVRIAERVWLSSCSDLTPDGPQASLHVALEVHTVIYTDTHVSNKQVECMHRQYSVR